MILSSPAIADDTWEDNPYLKDRVSHQKKMDENIERWMTYYKEYSEYRFDPEHGLGIQKDWMADQREKVEEPLKYWELNPVF